VEVTEAMVTEREAAVVDERVVLKSADWGATKAALHAAKPATHPAEPGMRPAEPGMHPAEPGMATTAKPGVAATAKPAMAATAPAGGSRARSQHRAQQCRRSQRDDPAHLSSSSAAAARDDPICVPLARTPPCRSRPAFACDR
jgi:hypothetical protein